MAAVPYLLIERASVVHEQGSPYALQELTVYHTESYQSAFAEITMHILFWSGQGLAV